MTAAMTNQGAGAGALPGFNREAWAALRDEEPVLREKRAAGWQTLQETLFPTARDEEWRRTDPALLGVERHAAPALLPLRTDLPASGVDGYDVVVTVRDDGYAIEDVSGALAKGLFTVLPLARAAADHAALVGRLLQGPARTRDPRPFTALNDAFWNIGLFVHVPPNVRVPGGVLVRYDFQRGGAVLPRMLVVAESCSELTVAEQYVSSDSADLLAVGSREFYAAAGAQLKVVSLQEWGTATAHVGEDWARAERDARIDWVSMLLGGRVSKMMAGCDVREPNANAYLTGLFFANGEQHIDQRTIQLHSSPDTYSNLLYKGAVKDRGHSVYQGIIDAAPGAIRVDAYQMNNNLILNDGARADSLPGLEIDADDLKCSHGATMGNLDPVQQFYLQSRGLSGAEARQMLVMAFFEEVIDRIPQEAMRERARELVARKMGGAPAGENSHVVA